MSRHPAALRAITALLDQGRAEPLEFRAGSGARIAEILAALPIHDRVAGMSEVRALLGLVVLLREERASPRAAELLDRALSGSPEAVQYLIELEVARLAKVERTARSIASDKPKLAPRVEARAPVGSVKAGSLGTARDLDRRRAERR